MHTHSQIDDSMAQKSCSLNMHCIEDLSVGLYYLYHYLNTRSICLRLVVYIYSDTYCINESDERVSTHIELTLSFLSLTVDTSQY